MNMIDLTRLAGQKAENNELSWDGDNSEFMLKWIIPNLKLCDYDKAVLTWAYGGTALGHTETRSYEKDSDGETGVKNLFLGGQVKPPEGVGHDYLNRVLLHETPDGHRWTPWEANKFYLRVKKATGGSFRLRWRRYLGLTLSGWIPPSLGGWWRASPHR